MKRFQFVKGIVTCGGAFGLVGCLGRTTPKRAVPTCELLPMSTGPRTGGYIDVMGEFRFEGDWSIARNFSSGVAFVFSDQYQAWGAVDIHGKYLFEPIFAEVDTFRRGFQNGLIAVKDKETSKWGFLDSNLELRIAATHAAVGSFSEGLCCAYGGDGLYGFIDVHGEWVIEPRFQVAMGFSEGLAFVLSPAGEAAYVDRKGVKQIQGHFDSGSNFAEGKAGVRDRNGSYYIIDRLGNVCSKSYEGLWDFKNGLIRAKTLGKWGLLNHHDNFVISPNFTWLGEESEGMFAWKSEKNSGYAHASGKVAFEFGEVADQLNAFRFGIVKVRVGHVEGYVNREGKYIIQRTFI